MNQLWETLCGQGQLPTFFGENRHNACATIRNKLFCKPNGHKIIYPGGPSHPHGCSVPESQRWGPRQHIGTDKQKLTRCKETNTWAKHTVHTDTFGGHTKGQRDPHRRTSTSLLRGTVFLKALVTVNGVFYDAVVGLDLRPADETSQLRLLA